jgi:hypothetical protein
MSWVRAAGVVLISFAATPAPGEAPALAVTPGFVTAGSVSTADAVMLTLSRPLAAAEGRLAVLVGRTDWSDLFTVRGTTAIFTPGAVALPAGATELTAYVVGPEGDWRELGRFPLTVKPQAPRALKPALDVAFKAQLAESHRPEDNAPDRDTFRDLSFQAALEADGSDEARTRRASVQVVGATYANEALRFDAMGLEAPKVDLAAYGAEVARGRARLAVGGVTVGRHRHLLSEFEARGATGTLPLGLAAAISLTSVSGTKLVGWDNPLGVDTPEHRLYSATLGVELLPSRPGGLRLEADVLDGSVLPVANYNQGVVKDAITSRGLGLRLTTSDASGRFRLDGSFARSRSTLAPDAQLESGLTLPAEPDVEADARFARAEIDVLKDVALAANAPLTLTLTAQHERLDPLYRSVGVEPRADLQQDALGGVLALGEARAQFVYTRGEDNLGGVTSILKTLTRQAALDVALPLGALLAGGGESAPFLPQVTYALQRVHQLGAGLPPNSDFAESHVPDQVSLSHNGGVLWQGEAVSLGYTLTASRQDNRQPGRERADFVQQTHQVALGVTRNERFDAGVELQLERGRNEEAGETDRLRRIGFTLNQRLPRGFGLTATFGAAWTDAEGADRDGRTLEGDLQASWRLGFRPGEEGPAATLFVRGATQRARTRNPLLSILDDRAAWQVSAGLNLSAF